MKRMIVKFLSLFIKDIEKRKEFRRKHDPIERTYQLLLDTRKEFFQKISSIGLADSYNWLMELCPRFAIIQGKVKNYAEHEENLKKLKLNLDKDALLNLEVLLKRISLLEDYNLLPSLKFYYTDEEYANYINYMNKYKEINEKNGFFQYLNYKLPKNEFIGSVFFVKQGLPQVKTLNKLSTDELIIDAGAFIGDSALILREFLPNNPIVSFEASANNYQLLLKTIELNSLDNIQTVNLGVSDKDCVLKFSESSDGSPVSSFVDDKSARFNKLISVHCTSLDNYFKNTNSKIGLIRCDVEGSEMKLLHGAIEIIKRDKPILMISIYHNYEHFYKIKPWIENLNLGYKFDFCHTQLETPLGDTMLIAEVY